LFEEIAQFRLPGLHETSWDLIVDLRNHPYLEKFRKMLSLAQSELDESSAATWPYSRLLGQATIAQLLPTGQCTY